MSSTHEAEHLHESLCNAFERLFSHVEGARFDARAGYHFVCCPRFPLPQFNGLWAQDSDRGSAVLDLADVITEIERLGVPCWLQTRLGRMSALEAAVRSRGLTMELRLLGMAVTPDDLRETARSSDIEITRVEEPADRTEAARVAAVGFGAPADLLEPMYMPGVAALPGFSLYIARAAGADSALTAQRPPMPFIEVRGRRLEIERISAAAAGERGTVLVFLHEGLGCAATWRDFPRNLAAATGCPALIYSRFGYGTSYPGRRRRVRHDGAGRRRMRQRRGVFVEDASCRRRSRAAPRRARRGARGDGDVRTTAARRGLRPAEGLTSARPSSRSLQGVLLRGEGRPPVATRSPGSGRGSLSSTSVLPSLTGA